jgi:hypothetical protein
MLKDEDGRMVSKKEKMKNVCCKFYNNLYKIQEDQPRCKDIISKIIDGLLMRFTNEMHVKLTQTISMEELHVTSISMAKGKSPRPNDVVVEFYTFFWEVIINELFKTIETIGKRWCLLNRMNKRLIVVLHKLVRKKILEICAPLFF